MTPPLGPVILFDGVCNLCDSFVQWVVKRDPAGIFRFAPLQGPTAGTLLERHGLPNDEPASIVLVEEAGVSVRSTAALLIATRLKGGFWARPLLWMPLFVRDRAYDWVAANRYRWFGRKAECMVPTADLRGRFLP